MEQFSKKLKMKNRFLFILAILSFLVFTSSCSKQELKIEDKIARHWQYDISKGNQELDSTVYLTIIPEKYGEKKFTWYLEGRKNVGTWSIKDSLFLVLETPLQDFETGIDSISQHFDENGIATIDYYKENDVVSSFNNNKISPKTFQKTFEIIEISNTHLYLNYIQEGITKPEIFSFKYESKVFLSKYSSGTSVDKLF